VDLKRILEIAKPRPVSKGDFVSGTNDDRNNCTFKVKYNLKNLASPHLYLGLSTPQIFFASSYLP
jgi:hypothetical protein